MNPGVRLIALFTLIALSVWLGFLLGKGSPAKTNQTPIAQTAAVTPAVQHTIVSTQATQANVHERLTAVERAIDALGQQTDDRLISSQRDELFLTAMVHYNTTIVRDGTALLLEADYYQRNDRHADAMQLLMRAAEFPESNEQLAAIRQQQALIAEAIFARHATTSDWLNLIGYFDDLLLQDPNNDRFRLYLATAQANAGEIARAVDTIDSTGTQAGVSQREIDDLRDSLQQANAGPVRFRAEGNALIAKATLNAQPVELLVDTGATKTALATHTLRRLGAFPLNETAQVMTAAGRITAQLYEIPELVVEQTLFRNQIVLALDNPPARWDGLLGMDLLGSMNVDLSDQLNTR